MKILYNTNSITDILVDNDDDSSIIKYDKISNSVSDFIVDTIKSKGSTIKNEELVLEIKKFDAVISVIFKDLKKFITKIEDNMEEFKNTVVKSSTLKSEDITVGIKEELRQNTYEDFLSALVSDLFNSYIEKRYIKDSLTPETVDIKSFTFTNIICISTILSKDIINLSSKINDSEIPNIDFIASNLMEMFCYINKRSNVENKDIYKLAEYYRILKNTSIETPKIENMGYYDICVNLTYNFAPMFNNLLSIIDTKLNGIESWELEEIFPLNINYKRKRSVENVEKKFINVTLPFFTPEEIIVKTSEFIPALIENISKVFKNTSNEQRDTCIRKVTPYIISLKDKISEAFDKIVKINAGLQKYYTDRQDLIHADITFGSKKHPVTGSIEKIETIEDFVNKFIFYIYESYKKKDSKPITFYFDMNITLDIPRNETDKYYLELFNDMSNIIKPLFSNFSKKNVTAIKHYRKQDATIYELTYKIEFTDYDYLELFKTAKELSEKERSLKGLENY